MYKLLIVSSIYFLLHKVHCQSDHYTTPVPIIKQIDRHNDDGSYTYGYEAADKSFKIETKYPNGEVFGKYGFVDDQGKVREVEYGASKRGFEPAGTDINVPPPTLTNKNPYPLGPNEVDDGQYREDPSIYFKDQKFNRPIVPASNFRLNDYRSQPSYNPPQPRYTSPPSYNPPQPRYTSPPTQPPQPQYYQPPAPQHRYQQPNYQQPSYQPANQYNPYSNSAPQNFHPAVKNLDIWSGSYSIDYTGRK